MVGVRPEIRGLTPGTILAGHADASHKAHNHGDVDV
jgi:hypothetical protein